MRNNQGQAASHSLVLQEFLGRAKFPIYQVMTSPRRNWNPLGLGVVAVPSQVQVLGKSYQAKLPKCLISTKEIPVNHPQVVTDIAGVVTLRSRRIELRVTKQQPQNQTVVG